jgi:hypothetical protein
VGERIVHASERGTRNPSFLVLHEDENRHSANTKIVFGDGVVDRVPAIFVAAVLRVD